MVQQSANRLLVVMAVISMLVGGLGGVPATTVAAAPAAVQDICPEPNDTFQSACFIRSASDMLGAISSSEDVDAYRFEVLDFDTLAKVTLSDLPAPYEAYIADWRGEVIASSVASGDASQMAQAALKAPGSYYVFVRARTTQFSEGQPYRLGVTVENGSRPARQVLYHPDISVGDDMRGMTTDESIEYIRAGGKITMNHQQAGTMRDPLVGCWPIRMTVPSDFLAAFDARLQGGSWAGFVLRFAENGTRDRYSVIVDSTKGDAVLTRTANGVYGNVTQRASISAVNQQDRVYRIAVEAKAGQIRVNVNGRDILQASGLDVPPGGMEIGLISWGTPASASFDNVLVAAGGN